MNYTVNEEGVNARTVIRKLYLTVPKLQLIAICVQRMTQEQLPKC